MAFPEGDVYLSKLKYGVEDSDSVRRLQSVLLELPSADPISITGNYDDPTDSAVREWQKKIGDTPDPPKKSFLGPKQARLIFEGTSNKIIDDTLSSTLGVFLSSRGHKVNDSNVPLGRASVWKGVSWIIVHHTATPDSWSEQRVADFVKFGRDVPPLSQIVLGKSGTVWMCTRQRPGQKEPGRASHAGEGVWPGVPRNTMNEVSIGIECQNDGKTTLASTPVQYSELIKLLVSLCKRYGLTQDKILGHKEWSTSGKIDPRDDMKKIRSDVKSALAGPTKPVEPPTKPVEPPTSPPKPPSGVLVGSAALWSDYSGKPSGSLVLVGGGDWVKLDVPLKSPKIDGSEHHMAYVRINFKWKTLPTVKSFAEAMKTIANYAAKVEIKYVRANGDATAYDERHYSYGTKSVPFQQLHFESGDAGLGGSWFMKVHGGVSKMELTTRYAKVHTIGVL